MGSPSIDALIDCILKCEEEPIIREDECRRVCEEGRRHRLNPVDDDDELEPIIELDDEDDDFWEDDDEEDEEDIWWEEEEDDEEW